MGEANFYYFTCLKLSFKEDFKGIKRNHGSQAQQRYSKRPFQEGLAEPCQNLVRPAGEKNQTREGEKGQGCPRRPKTHCLSQAYCQMPYHQVQQEATSRSRFHVGGDQSCWTQQEFRQNDRHRD